MAMRNWVEDDPLCCSTGADKPDKGPTVNAGPFGWLRVAVAACVIAVACAEGSIQGIRALRR